MSDENFEIYTDHMVKNNSISLKYYMQNSKLKVHPLCKQPIERNWIVLLVMLYANITNPAMK